MELLGWAIGALIISLIAGLLGFTGIARGAATVAKVLFGFFILVAVAIFFLMLLGVGVVT